MIQKLITLALAPLLFLQGRRVQRTALVLPEAEGAREGVTGCGATFNLLVIGDSAAAGVGIACQQQALIGRLVDELSQRHTVHWRLVAKTGRRLADVQRALNSVSSGAVDLVVVSAGINDVLRGTSSKQWVADLQALARVLHDRFHARAVAFSSIPRIQNFPLLPQPLAWYLGLRARELNHLTHQSMSALPESWRVVDLDLPITAEFLARDGFHPNEAACVLWCRQVMAALDLPSGDTLS
ncbi:MAG: SGNH/GDSL hydrolase family protein [Steroidobacteraceae bacterium]